MERFRLINCKGKYVKPQLATIVCIVIQAALISAKAELTLPAYPPQEWRLSITFNFSRDVLLSFLDTKPGKHQLFNPDTLFLWFSGDCEIRGSTSHPVLARKLQKDGFGAMRFEAIGFVPEIDQSVIYSNAFAAIESFAFTQSFAHTNYNASGVDISINMEVNGRSISIKYDRWQESDALPSGVADLFTFIRRHLPSNYNGLFDYLRVPKLTPLTGDAANHYRRCEVHDEWMKVGDSTIIYGMPCYDKAWSEARRRLFPRASTYSSGGGVVSQGRPKNAKTIYCESCRKAGAEWRKKNKKKP